MGKVEINGKGQRGRQGEMHERKKEDISLNYFGSLFLNKKLHDFLFKKSSKSQEINQF